ncbi:hypothetical protein HAX54_009418 [Datura stramonium]|uniref:Uncharacterized protein n=1 Tax=Datura stramonium TaxID=4076 RepID=A0ABS8RWG1_DATST|nr:hypothetical protein [Datura stramonium]
MRVDQRFGLLEPDATIFGGLICCISSTAASGSRLHGDVNKGDVMIVTFLLPIKESKEDLLETHENGEVSVAINGEKEDTRHKIANPINLFEEFKDEEEEELNRSSREHLLETRKMSMLKIRISAISSGNPESTGKDTAAITTPPSLLKTTKHHEEKENVDTNLLDFSSIRYNGVQQEPSLKLHERKIGVDTSLSSWLVESSQDDTPNSKNSAGSVGNSPSERRARPVDRPILGALTVEDLKDEKHIVIGTVGSYLRHTGKATNVYSDSGISSH